MVRGCQKKMIHLRDTGSELFEEAIFVLKPGSAAAKASEGDMVREARRIIENNQVECRRATGLSNSAGGRRGLASFLAGAVSAGGLTALIIWIAGMA